MNKVRTAVIGAGKMGAIHSKVYHQLPVSELAAVVDVDGKSAAKLAKKYSCESFTDYRELAGKVDAVTISTPTTTHMEIAEFFITNNVAVMIEKPLAANSAQGRRIVDMAAENKVIAAVGHSERCNPVVQAMKRLDIEPKFMEASRISPYPFRSSDIGVVLDVMIHDIDIILSLASSPIRKLEAIGVNVIDKEEDICNARITFENGCIADITASRVALKTERKIRVFSKQAYLSVDYFKKTGSIIKADPNTDVVEKIRELKNKNKFNILKTNWTDLLHIEKLQIDDREPLKVEQESFLNAVIDTTKVPEVSAVEGLAAMECAEKILESIKGHSWD